MKEGLLERIRCRGYWRVNFQPLVAKTKVQTMDTCRRLVRENAVSLRGWDYPAFHETPPNGGVAPCGDYYEGWVEWSMYREFWRLFKSGQFLHYTAIRTDWHDEAHFRVAFPDSVVAERVLPIVDTIYLVTEMFVFLSRLARAGLYDEGVRVRISAEQLAGRALYIDDSTRHPFSFPRTTGAERFTWDREYSKEVILADPSGEARKVLLALFDCFGWNPADEQIESTQDALIRGRL
jgi:hypothetical protein